MFGPITSDEEINIFFQILRTVLQVWLHHREVRKGLAEDKKQKEIDGR